MPGVRYVDFGRVPDGSCAAHERGFRNKLDRRADRIDRGPSERSVQSGDVPLPCSAGLSSVTSRLIGLKRIGL